MPVSPTDTIEGRGPWMQTHEGRQFCPQDPKPGDICVNDIAAALSMTCRYGGHMDHFNYYSVAEHSILMFDYGFIWPLPSPLDENDRSLICLEALFHDAAEAYTGDLPHAIKQTVKEVWKPLEDSIMEAIWAKLGFGPVGPGYHGIVKPWDTRMVTTEKYSLMKRIDRPWAADKFDPLPVPIHCWAPAKARAEFLKRYEQCREWFPSLPNPED